MSTVLAIQASPRGERSHSAAVAQAFLDAYREALDFQKKYLETILGFMGLTDIRSVVVQPTLMGGPEVAAQRKAAAIAEAQAIAKEF